MTAAADRLAIVDLGSNSLRLMLCEGIGPDGPRGERRSVVIGLRRGAAPDGTLADEALVRLDAALAPYAEAISAFAPRRVVAVATSATRDAPNRAAVEDLVRGHLDCDLQIVAGAQEADLSFAGAALAVDGADPVLVVDVGGGSTELVLGAAGRRQAGVSLQLGAVRQTDAHLRADPPTASQLAELRAQARELITFGLEQIGAAGVPVVAVAGTATTLAAIDIGHYDPARVHRRVLTRDRIVQSAARLAALTVADRREVPGLDPARAGVIVAGAVILAEVLAAAGGDQLMVSERDILDGIALAAAGSPRASFHL